MNLHPKTQHDITVECSGRKLGVKEQCCVGYQVCVGTRGVVLFKSRDVETVQYAGGVSNCWRCV